MRQLLSSLLTLGLLFALTPLRLRGAEPNSRIAAIDLLVLPGEKPARLELHVDFGDQPVTRVWDETFARLFAFLDRDDDGVLDRAEARRIPGAFALRQVLWGQFALNAGNPPPFGDLDRDGSENISLSELVAYYRGAGLGSVLVGTGHGTAIDALTNALLQQVDRNQDGVTDEMEWRAAAEVLRELDTNDDELVGPGELVPKISYPGTLGTTLVRCAGSNTSVESNVETLPFALLPTVASDTHWIAAVNDRRKLVGDPPIAAADLMGIGNAPPEATWQARFGESWSLTELGEPMPAFASSKTRARLEFRTERVRFHLRADEGKLREQARLAKEQRATLFTEADVNSDGTVDAAELNAPKARVLRPLADLADRNGDCALSEVEWAAWGDLQEQVARGHFLLTILDLGQGLFEVLDLNDDGALSPRELYAAWSVLNEVGCITNARLDRPRLPHQLRATLSHGRPRTVIGHPEKTGPRWFQAMDRNGDGDVSAREFTGSAATFNRLDANGDLVLTADEAESAGR